MTDNKIKIKSKKKREKIIDHHNQTRITFYAAFGTLFFCKASEKFENEKIPIAQLKKNSWNIFIYFF
ncbi:MAG: hypothetical protein ACRC0V_01975 [Fusobacteriaceae bacterium]